ncbi:purine-nucleoside phosphorylase [Aestuariivirga litoralis]|uniref:Purine nucleoside phosphorylase n=1 Tax=Aestuariivirga litoralis TaxID=2650924 RepID=A0A2W2BL68_9HYPH|nr:purine-nucleoside phosphorylase [Aestuariivirga litoralis]PZF76657.1 purine-nucleoside phosphorylase [Aestuariivirga litoralis]
MNVLAEKLKGRAPKTAIILGSSLGALAEAVEDPLIIPYTDLAGFPVPKISGHAGKLFVGTLGGKEVAVLAGRAHPYESGNAAVMRPAIEMLKGAGIETLILTNAAGSLKPGMRPGSIMLISDHINYSGMNPLIGQHGDENFVPMTDAYDPALRARFHAAAKAEGIALHEGVYCWYSGPSFETPAEIRMFQVIGGSAVGMSTAPETILARRFGLKVAGLSVITNLAAGIEGASPSHEETKREGAKAAENMKLLVTRFLRDS